MSDGSTFGVMAHRALETIIGGKPSPDKQECATREDVRKRILKAPLPDESNLAYPNDPGQAYSLACDCIAHAMLTTSSDADCETDCSAAWQRAKLRYPNLNEFVHGASGFMVGWAWNTVRWLLGRDDEQSNPVIIEMGHS